MDELSSGPESAGSQPGTPAEPRAPVARSRLSLLAWFRERSGLESWLEQTQRIEIPRGARGWATQAGSLAALLLLLQACTGMLLLVHYRAGEAWTSVAALSLKIPFGWLFRGLHAAGSHLLVGLLLGHLTITYATRAYRRPRELTWATGALLLAATLAIALTGTLLKGDQPSLLTAQVTIHFTRALPWLGNTLADLLSGGEGAGPVLLHRMLAWHVAVLPCAMLLLVVLHLRLVRCHGLALSTNSGRNTFPWYPLSLQRTVLLGVIVTLLLLATSALWPPPAGQPANPLEPTPRGIRPAWFFLPLYQLLKILPPRVGGIRGDQLAGILVVLLSLVFLWFPLGATSRSLRGQRTWDALVLGTTLLLAVLGIWGWLSA